MSSQHSPQARLTEAYRTWRQLTVSEGVAIHAGQWSALAEFQLAKEELQSQIQHWTQQQGGEEQNREILRELIDLENLNAEALALCLAEARAERATLENSQRNLQNLRGTYSQRPAGFWQSYS